MTEPVTMNLKVYNEGEIKPAKILVESKKLVYNFFPKYTKDTVLSESQFNLLQRTAQKTGNLGVLEESDLKAANQKLKDSCTSTLEKIGQFFVGIFQ